MDAAGSSNDALAAMMAPPSRAASYGSSSAVSYNDPLAALMAPPPRLPSFGGLPQRNNSVDVMQPSVNIWSPGVGSQPVQMWVQPSNAPDQAPHNQVSMNLDGTSGDGTSLNASIGGSIHTLPTNMES